ncbi:hypothetical protein HPP92_006412 [Vanilla planifolia]|uniref:Inositol-pentakisphosphate 2-kinase n=1 Tax=Vanilla planifolia TaxID=51239 RepID=A0A835V9Z8_VANPL|nr:hypothetical protein HPP92_006412 [Vanilla planifolia]
MDHPIRLIKRSDLDLSKTCNLSDYGLKINACLDVRSHGDDLKVKGCKGLDYKGEGAANLVLGYCGSSPSLMGKVLRVHKCCGWLFQGHSQALCCCNFFKLAVRTVKITSNSNKCAPKDDICIAVEIKPKCGFLPTSEFIARRNVVKKYVTRFRVHQLLKLHLGEANFIDLGIKPLDKMIHYYELDNRIVSFYSKNVGCCENGAISN